MRREIDAEELTETAFVEPPFAFIHEIEAEFVAELIIPTARPLVVEPFVHDTLHVLRVGMTADQAELNRDDVHHRLGFAHEREFQITPTRVGAVGRIRRNLADILRRVDILTEGETEILLRARPVDEGQRFGEPFAPAGLAPRLKVGRKPGEFEPVGVVAILTAEKIVLEVKCEHAGFLRGQWQVILRAQ